MRNKILVVEADEKAREELEQILQEVMEGGGELFFTQKREDALAILEREHPAIILLDFQLAGKDLSLWKRDDVHLILTGPKGERAEAGIDYLEKPFKTDAVLDKCRPFLSAEVAPPILPM